MARRVDAALAAKSVGGEPLTEADAPPTFTPTQRAAWAQALADAPRRLCRADRALLAEYVAVAARLAAFNEQIEAEGPTTPNRFGIAVPHPLLDHTHRLAGTLRHLCAELAFSPKAREAVKADPPPEEDNPFDFI